MNLKLEGGLTYILPSAKMFQKEKISLSFNLSLKPTFEPIEDALLKAINITKDCPYRRTFHSDQGWAYQMNRYTELLKVNKIFQSMSRKSTCLDNSPMENFSTIIIMIELRKN